MNLGAEVGREGPPRLPKNFFSRKKEKRKQKGRKLKEIQVNIKKEEANTEKQGLNAEINLSSNSPNCTKMFENTHKF